MWKNLSFQRNIVSIELKHVALYSIIHTIAGLLYSTFTGFLKIDFTTPFFIEILFSIFIAWTVFCLFFSSRFAIASLEILEYFDFFGHFSFYILLITITVLNVLFSIFILYSWSGWIDGIVFEPIVDIFVPFAFAALLTALF